MLRKIKTALLSVSDKSGIVKFAQFLASKNIQLISTGGTCKTLRDAGLKVMDISELTGFPEMLDGRVKTLHPAVHGGLLAIRDNAEHQAAVSAHGITAIDLVVVNLYPFAATVAKGAGYDDCIENIDIGGPAMIRSAAKNHGDVVVVTSPDQYADIIAADAVTDLPLRTRFAAAAYAHTAAYDAMISQWFAQQLQQPYPAQFSISGARKQALRYGENPHQSAALYRTDATPGVVNAVQLQGKELSYNNIADTDAAFELVSEFTAPAVAIIKHANPCGVAVGTDAVDAFRKALACDPVSAYGGIIACNRPFTAAFAETLGKLFAEVIIAPVFDAEARAMLSQKQNLRLLETGAMLNPAQLAQVIKTVSGGFLVQNRDAQVLDETALKIVTKRAPTAQEMADLRFAFTVAKHVKSNAIVYAKDGTSVAVGAGQMSRIDSARIGAWKAKDTNTAVENAAGSVLASDAFFPFADGLISAAEHGITAVIQPGGSIRDEEVIAAADERNIAMVFTGLRHFRH